MVRVQPVSFGMANRYSYHDEDIIEINKHLLAYPELYEAILKHEMSHTTGRYKFKDLMLDLNDGIKKPGYWKFIVTHPSTWVQLAPIWWTRDKGLVMDIGNLSNMFIFLTLLYICLKLFLRFVP